MRIVSRLSDRDLDRLFAGEPPREDGDLEELADFFADTKALFERAPSTATEVKHLAAMAAVAPPPDPEVSTIPRQRSRLVARNPFTSRSGRVAAIAAVGLMLLAAFGGAASAGALPSPIQGAVAGVADNLGVSLPDANDKDDGDVNNVDNGPVGNVDDGAKNDLNEGVKEEKDDGAVGNEDQGAVADTDAGPVQNKDDGPVEDKDDGAVGDKDDGPVEDKDDGAQEDRDDQAQKNHDDGDVESEDEAGESRGGAGDQGSEDGQNGDEDQGDSGDQND